MPADDPHGRPPPRPHRFHWLLPEGDPDRLLAPGPLAGLPRPLVVGRLLVAAGLVVSSFAAFQLWGTALIEWHAQQRLTRQLEALPVAPVPQAGRPNPARAVTAEAPESRTDSGIDSGIDSGAPMEEVAAPTAAPRPMMTPTEAAPVGRIELPSLGVAKTVVHGVARSTLRQGPGHYPSSPLPGLGGNVAIAGHRTTHGAPFRNLDRLRPGDEIHLDSAAGRLTYRVQGHVDGDGVVQGHRIVEPSAVEVLADHGDDRLTLTACHPPYSARERIVVSAVLVDGAPLTDTTDRGTGTGTGGRAGGGGGALAVGARTVGPAEVDTEQDPTMTDGGGRPPAAPAGPVAAEAPSTDRADPGPGPGAGDAVADSLGWQRSELEPTVLWGSVTTLVLFAGWATTRRLPRWLVYPMVTPAATGSLFVCYLHLERLLPAY